MVSMNVFIIMMQFGTERGRENEWMDGIHAHHDIIHCIYCI